MVYAREFAVILRRDGAIAGRWISNAADMETVLDGLPTSIAEEVRAQWANLRLAHPPLELGQRTVRLDQPQVMGILNVTPDSFSDGGRFLDDPETGRAHAYAMIEAGAAIIDIGGENGRAQV